MYLAGAHLCKVFIYWAGLAVSASVVLYTQILLTRKPQSILFVQKFQLTVEILFTSYVNPFDKGEILSMSHYHSSQLLNYTLRQICFFMSVLVTLTSLESRDPPLLIFVSWVLRKHKPMYIKRYSVKILAYIFSFYFDFMAGFRSNSVQAWH